MQNLLLNKDAYLAPLILQYGNLLTMKCLYDLKLVNLGITLEYRMYFKPRTKSEWWYIKGLLKYETYFNRSLFINKSYCLVFTVPKSREAIVSIRKSVLENSRNIISFEELYSFVNKKAPSTVKQARLFLFTNYTTNMLNYTIFYYVQLLL